MLTLNDDGSITIEFPPFEGADDGIVKIPPPKWGAYKRIRAERERIADELVVKVEALDPLDAMPAANDVSDDAKEKRKELNPLYRKRQRDVQDMTGDSLVATWRFILLGDRKPDESGPQGSTTGSFDGLAVPRPPDDPDEWPAELLIDAGDIDVEAGPNGPRLVRTNDTLLEAVHKHWGKARFRSGPTDLL